MEIDSTRERDREQKTQNQLKIKMFFVHVNVLKVHFYTSMLIIELLTLTPQNMPIY